MSLQEEEQLYTTDHYFAGEEADDKSFCVGGMEITSKLLADAIHALPEEKRNTVFAWDSVGLTASDNAIFGAFNCASD